MSSVRLLLISGLAALALSAAAPAQTSDLGDLHDALRLAPTQEDAWRTFAAASAPDPAQAARDSSAQQMLPRLTSPQRADLSIAVMQADLETLERRAEALKTFYATLTPAQQATFDHETAPREQ